MAKTHVQLKYASSIWPVVDQWADENNYQIDKPGETTRLYLRQNQEADARISVTISQAGEEVQISAWFSDLLRKELEIDSPSFYSALPRKEAYAEIQKLLQALGYTPAHKTKSGKKQNLAFNLGRSIRRLSKKK